MVGVVVRIYGWMLILGRRGVINEVFLFFLDEPISLINTTVAVIIGLVGVLLPFFIFPVYSSIENMNESLPLAARNLGANQLQMFYKIVLPLSLPGIVTGSILCFTLSMSAVITPNLLGGRRDVTIGALMYDIALSDLNWPFASAMAVTIAGVMFALMAFYFRVSNKYLTGVQ